MADSLPISFGSPGENWVSRPAASPGLGVSKTVAGHPRGLFGQRQRGGHELSVCERAFVHIGGNYGCTSAARRLADIRVGKTHSMSSIAYVTNSFPEASEAYVAAEILALRRRGCRVVPFRF